MSTFAVNVELRTYIPLPRCHHGVRKLFRFYAPTGKLGFVVLRVLSSATERGGYKLPAKTFGECLGSVNLYMILLTFKLGTGSSFEIFRIWVKLGVGSCAISEACHGGECGFGWRFFGAPKGLRINFRQLDRCPYFFRLRQHVLPPLFGHSSDICVFGF